MKGKGIGRCRADHVSAMAQALLYPLPCLDTQGTKHPLPNPM